jgi:hypothetical protein
MRISSMTSLPNGLVDDERQQSTLVLVASLCQFQQQRPQLVDMLFSLQDINLHFHFSLSINLILLISLME